MSENGLSEKCSPFSGKHKMSEAFVGPASPRSYAHNLRWFQHCWTRLGYLGRNLAVTDNEPPVHFGFSPMLM